MLEPPLIGCAGWSLRTEHQALFGAGGSHLARYASRFNAVEIKFQLLQATPASDVCALGGERFSGRPAPAPCG